MTPTKKSTPLSSSGKVLNLNGKTKTIKKEEDSYSKFLKLKKTRSKSTRNSHSSAWDKTSKKVRKSMVFVSSLQKSITLPAIELNFGSTLMNLILNLSPPISRSLLIFSNNSNLNSNKESSSSR